MVKDICYVHPGIGLGMTKGNFKSDPWKKLQYNSMDHSELLKEYCDSQVSTPQQTPPTYHKTQF